MPTCFIITPIGESGSEIRRNADDLRDLIIRPALEPYGFEVIRGDHRSEPGQIDVDVVQAVQDSDLCIADISLPNPNVFYELGRRDETGKPIIVLKAKNSSDLPVDIATRRYIEYDLDSRRGIIDAVTQLKTFLEPMVKRGFESNGTGASLSEIAEVLKRVERKVDRLSEKGSAPAALSTAAPNVPSDADPADVFRLAIRRKNIPLAEQMMEVLSYRMNRHRWIDQIVEQVAGLGSIKAGDILIEEAEEFVDNAASFSEKLDLLGFLVSNLVKTDREQPNVELVERLSESILALSAGESPEERIRPYNQLNRLYYGIYIETRDTRWLEKAIRALETALEIFEAGYLYHNLAVCENARNSGSDKRMALEHELRAIEMDKTDDDDHLKLACELMHDLDDPRLSDYLSRLDAVNSVKAQLLRDRWHI